MTRRSSVRFDAAAGEPLGDDAVDFRREAETQMGRAHFDMLDVRAMMIYAGLPRDDRIEARVDCSHRCRECDAIARFDLRLKGIDVDAPPTKRANNHSVLGPAHNRGAKSDDLLDEIRPFTRRLSGEIASQAPADDSDLLFGFVSKRDQTSQNTRQQLRHLSRNPLPSQTSNPIAEKAQIGLQHCRRSVADAVSG